MSFVSLMNLNATKNDYRLKFLYTHSQSKLWGNLRSWIIPTDTLISPSYLKEGFELKEAEKKAKDEADRKAKEKAEADRET